MPHSWGKSATQVARSGRGAIMVSLRGTVGGGLVQEGGFHIGVLIWIAVGLIAGVLAKWVMPGPDPGGIIVTILIGMAGALVGGYVLQWLLNAPQPTDLSLGSILTATLGAIILLAVYRLITRRAA